MLLFSQETPEGNICQFVPSLYLSYIDSCIDNAYTCNVHILRVDGGAILECKRHYEVCFPSKLMR